MRKYDSYKESEIEYISEIPIHWKVKPLYTLFNEVKDKNKGNLESNVLSLSYGNIKKRNIESNMGLLPDSFETYNRIKKDDIVLRLTDLQNDKKSLRTGLVREKGIITSAYVTLRKRNENINAEYAHWLLHAFDVKKVFYNLGAGVRQSMGYSELKKMNLILPPRTEQKKIVDYLQHKISDIDKLVENLNVLINKLEQQRQSIITEAVTKGLNPNVKMKESGVEWIGEIPEHWEASKLKNMFILQRGHDLTHEQFNKGIVPVYASNGIMGYHDLITTKGPNVTVGRSGSVGKVNYVECDFWAHNTCIYVKDSKKNNMKYIYYILKSLDMGNLSTQTAVPTLDRKNIQNSMFVYTLDIEEQREIVIYLDRKLDEIETTIGVIEKQINSLKEYRQALIYEAVTGKIDVRDMELD